MKANFIGLLLLYVLSISCSESKSDSLPPVCDSTNSEFHQLYDQLAVTYNDRVTFDTSRHDYSFEVLSPKNICSIGYQSYPDIASVPYRIEIFDNTSATLIYSGDHVFSSTATSYVSVGSIPLLVGHSYTIKRIQNNWAPYITNTMGRLLYNSGPNYVFPFVMGDLKITDAFVLNTTYKRGIPFIDIVFEQ